MKIAYFDCFSGASGDMLLGSLLDAGLPLDRLKSELSTLGLTGYDIRLKKVVKKGIGGTQAVIEIDDYHDHHDHLHESHDHPDHDHGPHSHHHHAHNDHPDHDDHPHHEHHHHHHQPRRNLNDIRMIIESSGLTDSVKHRSIEIFTRLGEAEAKVHRTSLDDIHFHEIGAMDAIIDIVGSVIGLEALEIGAVYCSPLHVGSGTVRCAHGILPVPAPATAELIKNVPVYSTGIKGELLTPTGAAILTTVSSRFGSMPMMTVQQTGYGAGTCDYPLPNLLRVVIGEVSGSERGYEAEQAAVIETCIDDMNPQLYDNLFQMMAENGAMDTFLTPIQMKKNRPGVMVTVLCPVDLVGKLSDILMRETTSIGLRWRIENRLKAIRTLEERQTPLGPIRFKVAKAGNQIIHVSAEYEDCKRIAREQHKPLKEVMEQAGQAALKIRSPDLTMEV